MLRYLTAGESHGEMLAAVVDGVPAGLPLTSSLLNRDLARRQAGHGRGGRMMVERDAVRITSGVRGGVTLGSPLTLTIENRDWPNWMARMAVEGQVEGPAVTAPRPGHADLPGALKYGHRDIRNVLERASARETAARVAVGSVAKALLARFGARVVGHVLAIGPVEAKRVPKSWKDLVRRAEASPVRCADAAASRAMVRAIDRATAARDTVGGWVEVRAEGLPPGLGNYTQADARLDGRLAAALASIPAVKGVAFGDAFATARLPGSRAHDEIFRDARRGWFRRTNRAGGLEGGMTNGEPVVMRCAVKPVSTLMRPLRTADLVTRRPARAHRERSDVCMVPAAAVVAEAAAAIELARAFQEKFGGDSVAEMQRNWKGYLRSLR
jgi:chorismate synthase